MNERSVTHATFVVDRTYDASPGRVFAAFSDPVAKARWFSCHDDSVFAEFDFRVGGRERHQGGPPGGPSYTVDCRYEDIVVGQRIVYTYAMYLGEQRISVSLVTVELVPTGTATRLSFTEQGAYLDGHDVAGREHGTGEGLDRLGELLQREPAHA